MSTYVLMRILESAPHRYELGIKLLTLGRLEGAYDRIADRVEEGERVLDIGCGTGALSLRAAERGARVLGIDINPEMLAMARKRIREAGLTERIELREMGLAEIDSLEEGSFDVVMSGLCFSELGEDEIAFALQEIRRILSPGGSLMIADEIRPSNPLPRIAHRLVRAPLVALTYLLTGQTTHALENFPERVTGAGFSIESLRTSVRGSFLELVARNPGVADS
jgi:demethylmenaquinone methyltransferase/2-methoxy-6-polyprenyl-1,4-benzoquinol methylase